MTWRGRAGVKSDSHGAASFATLARARALRQLSAAPCFLESCYNLHFSITSPVSTSSETICAVIFLLSAEQGAERPRQVLRERSVRPHRSLANASVLLNRITDNSPPSSSACPLAHSYNFQITFQRVQSLFSFHRSLHSSHFDFSFGSFSHTSIEFRSFVLLELQRSSTLAFAIKSAFSQKAKLVRLRFVV